MILVTAGDLAPVIAAGEEALAMSLELGELWVRGIVLGALADARWRLGERERAVATLKEAVDYKHALDDGVGLAALMQWMACWAAERGLGEPAPTLLGCGEGLRGVVTVPILTQFLANTNARWHLRASNSAMRPTPTLSNVART